MGMSDSPAPRVARPEDDEASTLWRALKREGDRDARDKLVELYYPLVKHVARSVPRLARQTGLEDLEGFGAEGLIDAIDRYDPNRGVQFASFAVHRIKGAIFDGLRRSDWVPRSVRRKAREMQDVRAELYATHGREPTEEEEAAALGLPVNALRTGKVQVAVARVSSLDQQVESDDGAQVPWLGADAGAEPLSAILDAEASTAVRTAMRWLSDRERTVAVMSFGEGMTLAEIGKVLGVTESRVCQIRASAISRLRGYMHATGMGPEEPREGALAGSSDTRAR
jgi:RNA polymerase sigma factor FliA